MTDIVEPLLPLNLRSIAKRERRKDNAELAAIIEHAADEIERLVSAIAFVRSRSAHAGEILNEFDNTTGANDADTRKAGG